MNADERKLNGTVILKPWTSRPPGFNLRASVFICGCILLAGCEADKPTTQPSSIRDRQDAALKDPFGYTVDPTGDQSQHTGTFELDRDGLKKDTDHVLNP